MSADIEKLARQGTRNTCGLSSAETEVGGLVDAALEIVAQRRETKQHLRAALLRRDDEEALRLARVLLGVKNEVSDRTDSGLN
jgi:hypothetical protein